MPRVTYEDGRYFIDGRPFFFIGVDYQYYRDKRANWAARLDQLHAAHANVITFYVPWRHHLIHDRQTGAISYDFTGRTLDSRDLVHFLDLCAERGLYVVAKPGPFVHSELNIGGLPDVASPSFNPGIEPVRLHDGRPLYWEYDHTLLPSPDDPAFDDLAREWLSEVGKILAPHAAPAGHLIGIQLLDETIYCTSNDAPWNFGYDAPAVRRFHEMLAGKYGTVARYNELHGTDLPAFQFVRPPALRPGEPIARRPEDLLAYMDWGEFQWRLRRDLYRRYREYLGLDLPYLSNFAGITPPIVENVPEGHPEPAKPIPPAYQHLYPEWWFAQNRVDEDREIYHYGMISWLGVAAYNIPDASSPPGDIGRNEVFSRYINTARRRRGINMEENWGFATLYHPLSKFPIVPFFQTLASVAGGCTGYVVFTGVSHGYWLDELDGTTRKQCRTFPSDAPIGENGETGEMYDAMALLNGWFAREGEAFLCAEIETDIVFLLVPDYAAVSSWVPSRREWGLRPAIPRAGAEVFEPAAMLFGRHGVNYRIAELPALSDAELAAFPAACLHLAFFMDRALQERLVRYAEGGGRLILGGELPELGADFRPCTVLRDFVQEGHSNVQFFTGNVLADERALLACLRAAGWRQKIETSEGLRAFVYRNDDDHFVFFFHFGSGDDEAARVRFYGHVLDLSLGPKTSGVVRVKGGRIVSYLVKGTNEYEGRRGQVVLTLGDQTIRVHGDGTAFDL